MSMTNIFEFLSKDGNITPEKAHKSRQMQFHDKTAYVWGHRYWWDPSLLMNPFVGSRTLCHPGCYTDCVQAHKQTSQFQVDHPLLIILKVLECVFNGFPFQIKNFRQDIIKKHLQSSPSVLKNWSIDECEKQSDKMKQLVQTCEQRWWWPSALDTNGGGAVFFRDLRRRQSEENPQPFVSKETGGDDSLGH